MKTCLRIFYFFQERFSFDHSIRFSSYFKNLLYLLTEIEYGKSQTIFFLAFRPRKRRNTLNKRKTEFALTCNVKKVIRVLTFRSRENFDDSFFFQNVWYSLIASPISFNLIWGFRYLQFKQDALHRLYARHP